MLASYIVALLWLILFKFSLDLSLATHYQTGLNLVPFADASRGNPSEMIANFAVFIPLGLLLGVNLKHASLGRKFALTAALSLIAEITQYTLSIGAADITDVITNSLGGLLGLLLYDWGSGRARGQRLDRDIIVASAILLILVPGVLLTGRVRFQAAPAAKATLSSGFKAQDLHFDWPANGDAAIGTTEDGVIARTSNNEKPRPTASMAKVITALAIMDKQPLMLGESGKSYTMTAKDVANYQMESARGGSVVPVYEGMQLTQYEAMQMMLIASANNMADTLAEKVFGSKEAYVSYAQNMLKKKGFSHTVIADASGFNSGTASTPSELVAIGIDALRNPVIAEIVAQPMAYISGVGAIQNTNQLLGADGVVGIKTGTTDEAGNCLLFAANGTAKDGKKVTIVGVIMGDENADSLFMDAKSLLASAKQALKLNEAEAAEVDSAAPQMDRSRMPGR